MDKKTEEKLRKYVTALEITNKNLIVALKTMYKYTYAIKKTNEDLLNQMEYQMSPGGASSSQKDTDKSSAAYRLKELIMDMSEEEKQNLLTQLEDKILAKEVRDHIRKPFFMNVSYASGERIYNDFIRDISAGGLFIETSTPLSIGQDISLSFPFPDDRHVKIRGEVVRSTDKGVGVKFKLDDQEQKKLTECLLNMD